MKFIETIRDAKIIRIFEKKLELRKAYNYTGLFAVFRRGTNSTKIRDKS